MSDDTDTAAAGLRVTGRPVFTLSPPAPAALAPSPRLRLRMLPYHALRLAMGTARRLLPLPVKRRLVGIARRLDHFLHPAIADVFAARGMPLPAFPPLLPPEAFTGERVVLCNNALSWGGAERQVVNTLQGLLPHLREPATLLCLHLGGSTEMDFYRRVVLGDYPGVLRNALDLDTALRRLAAAAGTDAASRISACIGWMPTDVQTEIMRFAGDFAVLRPTVVHAWQDAMSIAAGYAARLVGVPRIIVASRNVSAPNFAYFKPHMEFALREIASCPEIAMINNSEAGARDYAAWLRLPEDRFRVLRNGIDDGMLQEPPAEATAALRHQLGIPAGAPVIGAIYRFYPEKRPLLWMQTALRVAAVRQDAHCVVFGAGPLRPEAEAIIAAAGLTGRVHFPGTTDDAALALSLFDVFLLTSAFEGTPNVVLEASLLGRPVVAVASGGTAEAIEPGATGLVVMDPDPEQLAAAVLAVLDDPSWRQRARDAGPAFVQRRFGLRRMLDETLALYLPSRMPESPVAAPPRAASSQSAA